MRQFLFLLLMLFMSPVGAGAQAYRPVLVSPPPPIRAPFNPAADYVTAGQDEPGYQSWYKAASWRPVYVRAFNNYLVANGVGGIVPSWQLLRTASEWQRCGADPFEVPPTADWVNIVAALRFVRDYIVPVLGPVEPVSVYRNPMLNVCAGGAETSTHRDMGAVDIVPLRPITREALMVQLCAIHTAHPDSNNGLGFYKGLRFHIDARKYREWGTAGARGGYGCNAVLAEGAAPFNPGPAAVSAPPMAPPPLIAVGARSIAGPPPGRLPPSLPLAPPAPVAAAKPPAAAPRQEAPADPLAPAAQ